ncbi:MAG: HNH endonuclease [Planctomycetota bacterium]|nr:HNH endonuclease [Planctomycetota bacterium]
MPIDVTTVMNALSKLVEGSARVIHPDDCSVHSFESWAEVKVDPGRPCIRTATLELPVPEVILLATYGDVPDRGVTFSRRNLYRRDKHACQYCGVKPKVEDLTIDHVVPRARGGGSTWENCVLACWPCNARKADRLPSEAGMALRKKPFRPSWSPKMVIARVPFKANWSRFVSDAYWNVELKE